MPTSFKGTRVEFTKIQIAGSAGAAIISSNVQFCDADGIVHAVTAHHFPSSETPELQAAAEALYVELRKVIEKKHYNDSTDEVVGSRFTGVGIAESLRGGDDSPDDPVASG